MIKIIPMKKIFLLVICLSVVTAVVYAQTVTTIHAFTIPKRATVNLNPESDIWAPSLKKYEMPKTNSVLEEKMKKQIKDSLTRMYQKNRISNPSKKSSLVTPPAMLRNFIGNSFNGFVPNDNDMAISNNGTVCSVTNTMIWSKNLNTNQIYGSYTLHSLMVSLGLQTEEFDPKIMYDPQANKFVLVCLNGFTDSTSHVIIGFSQTDSTAGAWNFYALPGNPLNNNLWTDFPMFALTQNELFITGNLLNNDSSWQTGFNETVIWQMNKFSGYAGDTLNAQLHSSIFFNGSPLRNLCPAKGGSQLYGPSMTFLSNRNFAPSNDTIFIVTITDTAFSPSQAVVIDYVIAGTGYHMPVSAEQPFVDKLAVNDARVLGAFTENGKIQFVASTLDTTSGNDGIYHGIIDTIGSVYNLNATIYSDPLLDIAYPNIAYSGTVSTSDSAIISLLQSSSTIFPGTGAVLFDGTQFSPIATVKSGLGYTNMLNGEERWGDYTGCQRKYDQPGFVWISGGYSLASHTTRTWIAELSSTTALGTEPIVAEESITRIFPNPATDRVTVQFANPMVQTLKMEVIDVEGRSLAVLFNGVVTKGENEFYFSSVALAKGIYFLRISGSQSGILAHHRFLKP